jgi:hypothetical protein
LVLEGILETWCKLYTDKPKFNKEPSKMSHGKNINHRDIKEASFDQLHLHIGWALVV